MSRPGRIVVFCVVLFAYLMHLLLGFLADREFSATSYLDLIVFASIALFTWRPEIASFVVTAVAVAGFFFDTSGPYIFTMALVTGLVVFLCSPAVTALYCFSTTFLALFAELSGQEVASGSSLGVIVIGLTSAMIGWVLQRQKYRVSILSADVNRLETELERAITDERERISDELHDVVAHDITVLLMHARALQYPSNERDREISLQAVSDSAVHAMTNVKRMIRIVGNDQSLSDTAVGTPLRVQDRINKIAGDFRSTGVHVDSVISGNLQLSRIVDTTLSHVVNECATNIMKHASGAQNIRIELVKSGNSVLLRIWNVAVKRKLGAVAAAPGYGLRRMSERVRLLGGDFSVEDSSSGWLVEASLPQA